MNPTLSTDYVTIVSGLPRSGTSMMMRMLEAGGIETLTDAVRAADTDNPRGYFEYEPVKKLDEDASWMGIARGKAVKVVSFLLAHLPKENEYAILFMERNVEEVLASQRAMLEHRVAQGRLDRNAADQDRLLEEDARLQQSYIKHLRQVCQWLETQQNIRTLFVEHKRALQAPEDTAHDIAAFLHCPLDITAMVSAVEPALYRQRAQKPRLHADKRD